MPEIQAGGPQQAARSWRLQRLHQFSKARSASVISGGGSQSFAGKLAMLWFFREREFLR